MGIIAHWLALPPRLLGVHEVFHVSMLQKYTPDPTHVVDWGELVIDANGTFEEGLVRILDSQDQVLRLKTVRLVKVLWQHRGVEENVKPKKKSIFLKKGKTVICRYSTSEKFGNSLNIGGWNGPHQ